jgi:hypothetical protein
MCFPVRFPPFGGAKKTCEPLVKSIQKDQAEKYKKSTYCVGEPNFVGRVAFFGCFGMEMGKGY